MQTEQVIDVDKLTERRVGAKYPALIICTPNDTVPLIVQTLEGGDMQLIIEFNGQRKVVSRISESAININRLLRTCGSLKYLKDEATACSLNSVEDYLNCIM